MNLLGGLPGAGITLGGIAVRLPGHEQVLGGPHAVTVKAGKVGHVFGHADGVFGAGFDAEAAEDAARVVDFEAVRGLGMLGVVKVGSGLDFYAVDRADRGAHVTGDALYLAVFTLGEDVPAAVGV